MYISQFPEPGEMLHYRAKGIYRCDEVQDLEMGTVQDDPHHVGLSDVVTGVLVRGKWGDTTQKRRQCDKNRGWSTGSF